jgi:parallel beta-helix repeat protein
MRLALTLAMVFTLMLSAPGVARAQIYLYDVVFIAPETTHVDIGDTFEVSVGFGSGFEIPHPPVIAFSLRWDSALLDFLDWAPGWLWPAVAEGEDHLNVTMGNPFCTTLVMTIQFRATAVGTATLDLCTANVGTSDGYVSIFPQPPLPASVHNLDTGLNYTTVQAAIDAPETLHGHTIQVGAGTYFEHVIVDKSIALIGVDATNTTIDASRNGTAVRVAADNVSIAGLTLQNSGHMGSESGILLANVTGSYICHTCVTHNKYGVKLEWSTGNAVTGNSLLDNEEYGIHLASSSTNNTVSNNTLAGNRFGIAVGAPYNHITDNTVTQSGRGIIITAAYTTLTDNTISQTTGDGILLIGSTSHHNLLLGNTLDANAGYGIRIQSSSNNTLQHNTVTGSADGIFIFTDANHNRLLANTVSANTRGIYLLYGSTYNQLIANIAAHNAVGIQLTQGCTNSTLTDNIAFANTLGIGLKDACNNALIGNHLLSNQQGLLLEAAANTNTIAHNSFVNNAQPARITAAYNTTWHTDQQGNYWSTYTGIDADGDGIGDTPYPIDANNTDPYPLMHPDTWWTLADINYDLKVNIYDVVLVGIAYTATPTAANWNPRCDIAEPFGVIDIYDVVAICACYGAEYTP